MSNKKFAVLEGLIKLRNKARKKDRETYGHDAEVTSSNQATRARNAMDKTKHDKSGAAKRAIFRSSKLESLIIEGFTKKINKAKKKSLEGNTKSDIQAHRKVTRENPTPGKEDHAALNAAGALRREGNKRGAKLFLKASKGKAFESMIIESINKLIEGKDDMDTDSDSISNAGGDSSTYAQLKAKKQGKFDKKNRDIESNRDNTLGRMGGFYDRKGNPYKPKVNNAKFKKGTAEKPLPLNLKGKPHPGKAMGNVRGKAINTSRSTGEEGRKSQMHQDAMNNLYSKLGNTITKRLRNFKNGNVRVSA
jgi:hypothetical protein